MWHSRCALLWVWTQHPNRQTKEDFNEKENDNSRSSSIGRNRWLASHPAVAQEAPGETRQPDRQLTRPGDNENIPGMHSGGTQELSKDDMHVVQQSLKSEGYDPGREDGVADDNTRKAIRDFQRDKELPMTGVIDQRTAANLGVSWKSESGDSYRPAHSPFS